MSKTKSYIIYTIEFIVAIVFISIDLKWFLVYAFMSLIFALDRKVDYLRKLIRVFQVANEVKITAIQRHLKISEKDIRIITQETMDNLSAEQRELLEKDIADLYKS